MPAASIVENYSVTGTTAGTANTVMPEPESTTTITNAIVTNAYGSPVTLYCYRVASAATPGAGDIAWRQTIEPNKSAVITGLMGIVIEADQTVKMYASVTAVLNVNLSGRQ